MGAERHLTYLDSSAIVKLVVTEPESEALASYLATRTPLVSSALARTEVPRALQTNGAEAVERGEAVLETIDLLNISLRVLAVAGRVGRASLRSLAAIHLASAMEFGEALDGIVTYDQLMAQAAIEAGFRVAAPR